MSAQAANGGVAADAATPITGPWGPVGAVVMCLVPILFLLLVTLVRRLSLPSRVSLPVSAALMVLIRLAYLSADPREVMSSAIGGCLEALVPLSVVFGAISLFQSMQHTKCLPFLMFHLKQMSMGCPIAETFLVGWAFACIIEGIGGFGAPVALGAPMLVALGHEPLPAIVTLVLLNCLVSHLGTVGMMIWFGFGSLNLGDPNLVRIAAKSAVIIGLPTFFVAPLAASFLCPWRDLRRAWLFVLLSVASAIGPTVAVAQFNHDVPIVVGGLCSFLVTSLMVKYRFGFGGAEGASPAGSDPTGSRQRAAALKAAAADAVAAAELSGDCEAQVCLGGRDQPAAAAAPAAGAERDEEGFAVAPAGPLAASAVVFSSGPSFATRSAASRARLGGRLSGALSGALSGRLSSFSLPVSTRASQPGASFVGGRSASRRGGRAAAAAAGAAGRKAGASEYEEFQDAPDPRRATYDNLDTCSMVAAAAPLVSCGRRVRGDGAGTPASVSSDAGSVEVVAATAAAAGGSAKQQPSAAAAGTQQGGGKLVVDVPPMSVRELLLRTLPITFTVVLLLVTRVPQLKLVQILRSTSPSATAYLGTLGTLSISPSLVIRLSSIFTGPQGFTYETLFVPCILPFVAASLLALAVFRKDLDEPGFAGWARPFKEAWARSVGTAAALMGAMALAELMHNGGPGAPGFILGHFFSAWMGKGYVAASGFLGALSSFVGGSVVAGNLTFGAIQASAARSVGLPVTSMLALQNVGACAGKMVCVANVVSAKAVLNLGSLHEGAIIRHTLPAALLLLVVSEAFALLFLLPIPGVGFLWPDLPLPAAGPSA